MTEAICTAAIALLTLGAWALKRRAYSKGYAHGEVDSSIRRQVRAAFAAPCWCGHATDPEVSLTRRQCAVANRCCVSGQPLTSLLPPNGSHLH